MEVIQLIMGEDENCLLCEHPHGPLPKEAKLPWKLCPTHYGDLTNDDYIADLQDMVAEW